MPLTRGQKGPSSKKQKKSYDLLQQTMQAFSQNNLDIDILTPINKHIEDMEQELQKKSFILMGPGHCGKNATVYWLMRDMLQSIVWLDCRIWDTDSSFLSHLLQLLQQKIKLKNLKSIITNYDINLKELSKVIKQKKIKITIVLKNPQKLAAQLRPVILYSILQWINFSSDKSKGQELSFIMITRDIRFIDNRQKRVKSRMNAPIIFISRPSPQKLKQILIKRVQSCLTKIPQKDPTKKQSLNKLKKALQQKQLEKILNTHYQQRVHPISYYLKIIQLVLAINIQSQQNWQLLPQIKINNFINESFQSFDIFVTDHKNIAKCFFSNSQFPEIILLGLYRNRFLRQKQGNYNCIITLGQLMTDYNKIKRRYNLQHKGNSFYLNQPIMQAALKNLIDWNFMAFSRISQKVSLMNKQLTSRYGPQDIQCMFKTQQYLPDIIKQIYNDY